MIFQAQAAHVAIFTAFDHPGMSLFGFVVQQPHLGLSGYATFEDFGGAMLLVLRMATSEGWTDIMHACMVTAPMCGAQAGMQYYDEDGVPISDCGPGNGAMAVIYFVSYQLFGALVMMNLMLGIAARSEWPSWWRHVWPSRAPLTASEGSRLLFALVRRGPASQIPPGGRVPGATPRRTHRLRRV